jgi:predicted Zn finger-like uncharacterized protein
MSIQVECPSCHATIRVRDEHAGRRGRCPHCKAVFAVPEPTPAAEPEPAAMPAPALADDDGDAYALVDAPRKAKAVRARAESLPGVGVSARGVVVAAAPTSQTLTSRPILGDKFAATS